MELFKYADILNDGKDLADALFHDKAFSVTDASVSTFTNTAAISWTIQRREVRMPIIFHTT